MNTYSSVLVVNCSPSERRGILELTPSPSRTVDFAYGPAEAREKFKGLNKYGVVFLGIDSADSEETRWMGMACKNLSGTPVIVISQRDAAYFCLDCLRQGAFNYIPRPVDWVEFGHIYALAVHQRTSQWKTSVPDGREQLQRQSHGSRDEEVFHDSLH